MEVTELIFCENLQILSAVTVTGFARVQIFKSIGSSLWFSFLSKKTDQIKHEWNRNKTTKKPLSNPYQAMDLLNLKKNQTKPNLKSSLETCVKCLWFLKRKPGL
jgi:hypothetical protein